MNITDFKPFMDNLSEGVIITDEHRKIIYINVEAIIMTGLQIDEFVPYCSYCQLRQIAEGEERCILASDNPLPSFRSHIPNYVDNDVNFEMTLKKMKINEQNFHVLLIRNPSQNNNEEALKVQQLLIQETMNAQENERKRISRELHDNVGQGIYSIYLGLEGIKRHVNNQEYHERLQKMTLLMEDTIENIKRLTKELRRPQLVDNLGFETALKTTIPDWEQYYKIQIALNFNLHTVLTFQHDEGLHLFRIIQEAVNNAVKHGNATSIQIQLKSDQNYIYFQISDNGKGFDIGHLKSEGLGLKHMKERVKMLKGDVKWISQMGGPTRIEGFITVADGVN